MNLEKFMECSKNLTDEELKDIRNYINRELNRRSNVGKVYQDPRHPHRRRTFFFLDEKTMDRFIAKYFEKFGIDRWSSWWCHYCNDPNYRKIHRFEPDGCYGHVTAAITKEDVEDIASSFSIKKYIVTRKRMDGTKYNAAPDCSYIVEKSEYEFPPQTMEAISGVQPV